MQKLFLAKTPCLIRPLDTVECNLDTWMFSIKRGAAHLCIVDTEDDSVTYVTEVLSLRVVFARFLTLTEYINNFPRSEELWLEHAPVDAPSQPREYYIVESKSVHTGSPPDW